MSKQQWGNATWYMMHTLAFKLKPEFSHLTPMLLAQFQLICNNLPCPECSEHASRLFTTVNKKAIVDRDKLITFLFEFHNKINQKLNKSIFTKKECDELYPRARTNAIVTHFFQVLEAVRTSNYAMIYGFPRQICLNNFKNFLQTHSHIFIG